MSFLRKFGFFLCYFWHCCCDGILKGTGPGCRSERYDENLKRSLKGNKANIAIDTVETPEREQPGGTEEKGSKNDGMGNIPSYSLAGSGAQNPNNNRGYADEEYKQYNPQYGKGDDEPTWSLAQPFPHIVRPGMRHGALPEDRKEDKDDMEENGPDIAQADEVRKQQSVEKRMKRVNDPKEDGFFNTWSKIRHSLREPLAEWLGVSSCYDLKKTPTSDLLTDISCRQLWQ